jgi:tetrahydromethanopterin S-methyltransferase subunit G
MGRVLRPDFEFIDKRLDEVEARIVAMPETDEFGKEVHE